MRALSPTVLAATCLFAAAAPAQVPRVTTVEQHIAIRYDDNLIVRTAIPPPFFDPQGRPRRPTHKELLDLEGPGRLPGFKPGPSGIGGAQVVTLYFEKEVQEPSGKVMHRALPPVTGLVHHNRPRTNFLDVELKEPILAGTRAYVPTILIGDVGPQPGVRMPGVRLKMVLIRSYYVRLR